MLTAAALIAFFVAVIVGCIALLVAVMPQFEVLTLIASYIDAFFFYVSKTIAIVRLFVPMGYAVALIGLSISMFAGYLAWQGIMFVIGFIRGGKLN